MEKDIFIIRNDDLTYGRGYVYSLQYHIVWCTKYRKQVLKDGLDKELKEMLTALAKEYEFKILAMEVMPDHVHLLADIDPRIGIDDFVGSLKRRSSHIIRTEFPYMKKRLPSLWTRGKFIATVGSISLETVKQYIKNQKGV